MSTPLSRRSFVVIAAGAGAGLLLGFRLPISRRVDEEQSEPSDWAPNAWLRIAESGTVTIRVAKAEMGQGVWTALPMIVAEELDADWSTVRIEQSPARSPYETATGGSDSVASSWLPLRQAGAVARAMLVAAAAAEWNVDRTECETAAGSVLHRRTSRSLSYGALAGKAASQPVPDASGVTLKAPESFRLLGKPVVRRDLTAKTDGSAIFGIDVHVPGMLVANVARCPVFDGKLLRVDDAKARAVKGVRQIVTLDAMREQGLPARVAVVADNTWAAMKGRRALAVEWDAGADGEFASAALSAAAHGALRTGGDVLQNAGDVDEAKAHAMRIIEQTYEVPFLAHATMEPMNCTAHVTDTSAELWVPTQYGDNMQRQVAKLLNLPVEAVTVHVTLLGGGFGRRFYRDFVIDAVQIAKAVGAPVKVVWSREEDVQHDMYRPMSVQRLTAALDERGRPVSWENRVAGPSSRGYWSPGTAHPGGDDAPETIAYSIPNRRADFVYVAAPVPIGAWRAVRHTQNIFSIESFVDELAHAARVDPIEYRLLLLDEHPRGRNVLNVVRERSGWTRPLARNRGRGVAFMKYGGSYVAQVAEVTASREGNVHVDRVTCALDCGQMINPDTVRAQVEGAIVWGLSATLWGEITVAHGRTVQSNFHDYRVARMADVPVIDVELIVNHEIPSGVGEPAVPGVAPAITNALFAATGRRVRRLPLTIRNA